MRAGRVVFLALSTLAVGVAPDAGAALAAEPSLAAGRDLFIGSRPFQNGGAPCGACHGLGGEGLAFTASLGPELSAGLSGMDPEALDGLLEALPFPTMMPIYGGRALTPAERADLTAYLIQAAKKGPPRSAWHFELYGLIGAGVLFLGLALAWRRRKPPSRTRLLARAANLHGGSR
jgi:mono/diheme cytochrome c family protein